MAYNPHTKTTNTKVYLHLFQYCVQFHQRGKFFWVQDQDDTKFKMVTNAYKAKTNVAAVAQSNTFAGAR